MKRILIVNVNWLGDVLFSTPAIRAIKKAYPDCYLACTVVPRVKELLENNPYLDELIIFDEKTTHWSPFAKIKFISELRKKKFDTAILFHRSFTRALICYLAGIKERIGYYTKKRSSFLTRSLTLADRDSVHRVDYFLGLLQLVGIEEVEDKTYDFILTDKDHEFIKTLFNKNSILQEDFIVIAHVGANWSPKRWPPNHFAKLLDKLIKEFNAKVIITGSKKDLDIVNTVSNLMINRALILCGKTTLSELGALMQNSSLVVSADSGPLHIAAAVGAKRIIALFGPTLPEITGPKVKGDMIILRRETGCIKPCYLVDCRDNRCMYLISTEDVLEAIRKLLEYAKKE